MSATNCLKRLLAAALLTGATSAAQAQAVPDGPAEVPPVSYTAPQYVDSTGCVFVRAGVGGQVTWVPRVNRDRTPVCGYQPSFSLPTGTPMPAEPVPVRTATTPVVIASAAPTRAPAAPRTAVRVDPVVAAPSKVGTVVTLSNAASKGVTPTMRVVPKHLYGKRAQLAAIQVPKGYRPAWTDDRLNLRRAEQTLAGHAAMKQVWTSTVPRRLVDR